MTDLEGFCEDCLDNGSPCGPPARHGLQRDPVSLAWLEAGDLVVGDQVAQLPLGVVMDDLVEVDVGTNVVADIRVETSVPFTKVIFKIIQSKTGENHSRQQ